MKPWAMSKEQNTKGPINKYILNQSHCALIACFHDNRTLSVPFINMHDLLILAPCRGNSKVVEFIFDSNDSRASKINKSL
jgi:hypothetical protein